MNNGMAREKQLSYLYYTKPYPTTAFSNMNVSFSGSHRMKMAPINNFILHQVPVVFLLVPRIKFYLIHFIHFVCR